jgi:LPPG:FO 2-phospho-L-lactate transferase
MSDDSVATQVITEEGVLNFQEYFVRHQCQPKVQGFRFNGIEHARPSAAVMKALENADLVIFCPSNPWVSLDPILALPGIKTCLQSKAIAGKENYNGVVIAVSPIIGGKAVKGPAAKMFVELGLEASAQSVAEHYGSHEKDGLLDGFVLDYTDVCLEGKIQKLGVRTLVTDILMNRTEDRIRLASEVMTFGITLLEEKSRHSTEERSLPK